MTEGPHDDIVEPAGASPGEPDMSETPAGAPESMEPESAPDAPEAPPEPEPLAPQPEEPAPNHEPPPLAEEEESVLPPPPPLTESEVPTPPPLPPRERSPELVRTNGRRVLAGVGSGIGEYLGISPWIPRLIFIFFAGFGGFGLLAYVTAWLLIRREDEDESIAERLWDRLRTGQNWLGALLVFIAALIIIASFDFLRPGLVFAVGLLILGVLLYRENIGGPSTPGTTPPRSEPSTKDPDMTTASFNPPAEGTSPRPQRAERRPVPPRPARPPRESSPLGRWTVGVALLVIGVMTALDIAGAIEPFPRHYAAALLGVTGAGLLVGTVVGRARWLIVPGLILLPIVVGASFVDIPFDGEFVVTSITEQPGTLGELQEVYDVEAGSFTLDLTELEFDGSDSVLIDMGAGELTVILPEDLAANVDVQVGVGDIGGVIGNSDGIGLTRTVELDGTEGPLQLDIQLGAGEVDVVRGG